MIMGQHTRYEDFPMPYTPGAVRVATPEEMCAGSTRIETNMALYLRYAMRRFVLLHHDDETGISGEGVVAEGIEFSNGVCCLNWLVPAPSVYALRGVYPSIKEVENIYGHGGKTTVEWID